MMSFEPQVPVITIDGPSGTGKGTISHLLAEKLGWHFLDSGSLYRVLAYAAVQKGIGLNEVESLVSLSHELKLRFEIKQHQTHIYLNDEDISRDLRQESCGQNASKIAAIPEIRTALLEKQRAFATPPGLVTDGRDMGTVVFPKALLKIFLYASTEERATRRFLQLKDSGNDVSLAQVIDQLVKRDERDEQRAHSPLRPADDAVMIDTTSLTIEQVFDNVLQLTNERLKIVQLIGCVERGEG